MKVNLSMMFFLFQIPSEGGHNIVAFAMQYSLKTTSIQEKFGKLFLSYLRVQIENDRFNLLESEQEEFSFVMLWKIKIQIYLI